MKITTVVKYWQYNKGLVALFKAVVGHYEYTRYSLYIGVKKAALPFLNIVKIPLTLIFSLAVVS